MTRQAPRAELFVVPFLWIVAAGRSGAVLAALKKTRRTGWPKGVHSIRAEARSWSKGLLRARRGSQARSG